MTDVLLREERTLTYREEGHLKMEVGRDWTYATTISKLPAAAEVGRGKKGSLPRVFKGSIVLLTPEFQNFILQNYDRINFCCFRPPNL